MSSEFKERMEQTLSESAQDHRRIDHWKIISILLMVYDFIAIFLAYFLALWIRFDAQFQKIPYYYIEKNMVWLPLFALICIFIFWRMRLYNSMWRFASYSELIRMGISTIIALVVNVSVTMLWIRRMPITYYVLGIILQFGATMGIRFSYRFLLLIKGRVTTDEREYHKRVMLVGAGAAGQMVIRNILGTPENNEKLCCIIDDNRNKWGRYIDGVPIVGGRNSIIESCKKYGIEKIYIAIPSASLPNKKEVLNICKETGCKLKNMPDMSQVLTGNVTASMKDVGVEDLLGRDPIVVNMEEIGGQIKDKVILVTGGGGSIGSELCRQIAKLKPKQLIIFDIYENNAYDIQLELKRKYPQLDLVTLIGSVRDSRRIMSVFSTYHPDIVYHAAAHKHVPLMEDSPCESIKNNVIGTYKTAYAAVANSCSKFVLISTDKAVNPTNIMGASKRLCEMIIQSFDSKVKKGEEEQIPFLFTHMSREDTELKPEWRKQPKCKTEFVAVRFGNVLGSNGSVIPLFKKQILAGGPVTVTHKDIIRYFMTIPEAVSLVLQAGCFAGGGEIFVLDMGEPVPIDMLARNLIKLSGYKPDVDIKIEYTGLRPGEKLYEEKLMAEEGIRKTDNNLIHIGMPIEFDTEEFLLGLRGLLEVANANGDIIPCVEKMVSTYHPIRG
ncbi:MAG: nucleoside-diphosphate sugar epimerase/dehydratase [Lachnospiraceae bacterium]|nr:nucleoside-diphosphate sugar epimerase/dehydratase [Lachnospiraceae bacterium]MDY5742518.1 nucleoside-diphosphate sugar epimerase/dehydratase [Lachnospiraceae bacterium]